VSLRHYPPHRSGKVRELFDLGDALLIVATDRLSAFDVILPTPIPGKGRILSAISDFWFDRTMDIIPNHRMDRSLDDLNLLGDERTLLEGRSSIVRKAARIDIECVVRGYLAGSGWKEYEASGTLAGIGLPLGLSTGAQLPEPAFTPAVKNDAGHDQNISRSVLADLVGRDVAQLLEARSLDLYERGSEIAARAGFTLADTKFEFGWVDEQLTLIDEALTPDSSRYWDITAPELDRKPASFDKQIVRDWLETTGWNKMAPGPAFPPSIVNRTRGRYRDVLERLTHLEDNGGTT
jgi:phosphoribosylaminoimidazole-succinocarboxamide synthase